MLQIRKIKPEDIEFVMKLTSENGCTEGRLLSNIENFLICENDNLKWAAAAWSSQEKKAL